MSETLHTAKLPLPTPLVDGAWLRANLETVTVVDVRWYIDGRSGHDAYLGGHIPSAVWADLDTDLSAPPSTPGGRHPLPTPDDFAAAMGRLGVGDDSRVVCYDDAGGGIAARLWWMLDALGHEVAVLDGGIAGWIDAGGALAEGEAAVDPAASPTVFTVRPWPTERLIDGDAVAAAVQRGESVLLDARSAERYRGDDNPIDPRFGHIPSARSAPWNANIDPVTGRFLGVETLHARFGGLGVTAPAAPMSSEVSPEVPDVIAYCGSGVTACNNLLALQMMGVVGRLYVGSWSEWGADPERPIEAP